MEAGIAPCQTVEYGAVLLLSSISSLMLYALHLSKTSSGVDATTQIFIAI